MNIGEYQPFLPHLAMFTRQEFVHLISAEVQPWKGESSTLEETWSVATRRIEKKAPSDSLHYNCYISSPVQGPSSHQTIPKQAISCGSWAPPALDNRVCLLDSCDELGDSRSGPPHTHSGEYPGTLTGFLEENE